MSRRDGWLSCDRCEEATSPSKLRGHGDARANDGKGTPMRDARFCPGCVREMTARAPRRIGGVAPTLIVYDEVQAQVEQQHVDLATFFGD